MTLKQLQQYLHIVEVEYIFFYSTYTYKPIDSFLEFQQNLNHFNTYFLMNYNHSLGNMLRINEKKIHWSRAFCKYLLAFEEASSHKWFKFFI